MKLILTFCLLLLAAGLFAVPPLESGYPLAPRASASPEEKQTAYLEARNRVIRSALKYENTPYRYGGITAAGLDCSGFIYLSFRDALGVSTPRSASGLYSWTEKIPLESVQPGDLLFFRTDSTQRVTHVGLYLGNRRFIHSASIGPRTGVIINTLDEGNWTRNYAGAGRVFPEAAPGFIPDNAAGIKVSSSAPQLQPQPQSQPQLQPNPQTQPQPQTQPARLQPSAETSNADNGHIRLLLGGALAPVFNNPLGDGDFFSGVNSQLRFGIDAVIFKKRMLLGFELRPEYDAVRSSFRLPITLSWGFNDKFRVFAGPVYDSRERGWYGTIGITAAPFIFNLFNGEFAPYLEAAWQAKSYNASVGLFDSFSFSTGIRWTKQIAGTH